MAEKILQTRIINKHAELETWELSTLPLKEGEIALAKVMVAQPDGTEAPTYVAKIGLEGKTFLESPMLFAPASDVHLWAKAASKPTYNATEIKLTTEGAKSVQEEIIALKSAVGDTEAVAEMITAAIEALDVEDAAVANQFVTAVAEADGKISVTRRALDAADIPALGIDKITGLQSALDLKAAKTYVDEQDNAIKSTIGAATDAAGTATVYGAIATAKKAGTDAQTYAEGVNTTLTTYKTNNDTRVKAIEDDYTTAEEAGTIAQGKVDTLANGQVKTNKENIEALDTALDNLAGDGRTTETIKANADAIAKLAQDIGNVANVMNFRGVSVKGDSTTPGHDISNPQNGDVIIYGEAEYVYDGSNWIKFGDASDNATAISDLQTRVGNVETRLNTGDIHEAIVAAQTQADKGVADAATAQAKANANETAIGVINGTGAGSISKAVADEAKLRSDADTAINDKIGGSFDATNTVAKAITAAADAASAAQTTIDNHKSAETAHTKAQVGLSEVENKSTATIKSEFTGSIADGNTGFVTGDAVYDAIEAAKSAAATDATNKVNTLGESVVANTNDIDAIEANFAKVKATEVAGKTTYSLVVGASEDVIIFDCGGAE